MEFTNNITTVLKQKLGTNHPFQVDYLLYKMAKRNEEHLTNAFKALNELKTAIDDIKKELEPKVVLATEDKKEIKA